MTVELANAKRVSMSQEIRVVGNLIGEATVAVAPRTAGRLQDISVRLGDRVSRGQRIAKIEDFEIVEQVKQAEAAQEVSAATIRQREADLQLALTSVERSRNLFQRQLLPKQTLDDNEARYQSAIAQLDLARAQNSQSKARLDELRINLANTIIVSPVNGFVSKRAVDPGAFVSQNAPIVDVVDISRVRLVVNVVERDLKELQAGDGRAVEVDAYPGETFKGRIARVAPVLDPATRTAPIEIEIANSDFRLKPGMYARVGITTDVKKETLVVPDQRRRRSRRAARRVSAHERRGRLQDRGAGHRERGRRRGARRAQRRRSGDHHRCAGAERRRSHSALRRGGRAARRTRRPFGWRGWSGARDRRPRRGGAAVRWCGSRFGPAARPARRVPAATAPPGAPVATVPVVAPAATAADHVGRRRRSAIERSAARQQRFVSVGRARWR